MLRKLAAITIVFAAGWVAAAVSTSWCQGAEPIGDPQPLHPADDVQRPPSSTRVAKRYGVTRGVYSVAEWDRDRAKAQRWAEGQVRTGQIKPALLDKTARERAIDLRVRHYPSGWSKHEKLKLYRKEVAALEPLRKARDTRRAEAAAEKHRRNRQGPADMAALAERFREIQAAEGGPEGDR